MGILVNMVKRHYAKKEAREAAAAPAQGDRVVFYVPGGSCYHLFDFCLDNSEKEIKTTKESKAVKMGLRLCKKCQSNL